MNFLKEAHPQNGPFSITSVYIKGREQDQKSELGRKMSSNTMQLEFVIGNFNKANRRESKHVSIKLNKANTINTHFRLSRK